jgi:glutamyl-tRNA reductase
MDVICLGISHATAHVELRERFAVADTDLSHATLRLGSTPAIDEAVIVSTCNRVEFNAASEKAEAGFDGIVQFLGEQFGLRTGERGIFYRYDAPLSIRHLFRVVCGLESMVLGETEIFGQVKKAYGTASAGGTTARHLNKLFQRAFRVAKEVRSKTSITRGPVSVGSVAVDLAEKIFGDLSARKVMILGAGEASEQTARALFSRGAKSILVSNRSYDRAARLAGELGGRAIHFDEWEKEFHDLDIIISSTSAPHPILTREKIAPIMASRKNRPLFAIDLAVPRDMEAAINEVEGVFLYDIDSLQAIARNSIEIRRQELSVCEGMIERHVTDFSGWLSGGIASPVPALAPLQAARCRISQS